MRARRGQVALYLIAALVAICVLMLMNVGIYFSVSAKHKAINAGDAAALAAARHQGAILNSIGQMNIDHLNAAIEGDEDACYEIMTNQLRTCFLGPIDALAVDRGGFSYVHGCISAGNKAAQDNGASRNKDEENFLRDIVREIRQVYANDPSQYPEPWEGAWMEYAQRLENAANAGIWAGPDNICLPNADNAHILLDPAFYNAVAGILHCWFKFNAPGLPESFSNFNSWPPLPRPDDADVRLRTVNSIVYSLHLQPRIGSAIALLGTNLICKITGASAEEVAKSPLLSDAAQQWMFYDLSVWRNWWEIDPYGERRFPVVGPVKQEYNVRGCAAVCRAVVQAPNLFGSDDEKGFSWPAAAKPFGTVVNEDGELSDVTALNGFVVPAFDAVHLVPVDSIAGGCGEMVDGASPKWMDHVRKHLPKYVQTGDLSAAWAHGCWYCQQLVQWEKKSFRKILSIRIKIHGKECERPLPGSGGSNGGTSRAG